MVQRRASGDAAIEADVRGQAERGVAGPGTALPHAETIQRAFGGHDITGVRAHTDAAAAASAGAIGASAYATGNDVAFASTSPDLHTAAHEAAHVVQQRAGVSLYGGVGQTGDRYEQHADAVADLVVQGGSAESLLDRMAPTGASAGGGVQRKVVQRDDTPPLGGGGPLLHMPGDPRGATIPEGSGHADVTETDPQRGLLRIRAGLGAATPAEATAIATALTSAQPVPGADTVIVNFRQGGVSYRVTIPARSVQTLVGESSATELGAHPEPAPHITRSTDPSGLTTVLGGAMVALCGGEVGTERSGTLHIEVPSPTGMSMHYELELRVGHQGDGYHVTLGFRFGGGGGIPHVAEVRLMAGLHLEVTGESAASAAALVLASMRSGIAGVYQPLADTLFGGGQTAADRAAMRPGEETDASASIAVDGTLGHRGEHSAEASASAGISAHVHREGRAGGAADEDRYLQWDVGAGLSIGEGFRGTVEGHFPIDSERPFELTLRFSGSVHPHETGRLISAATRGFNDVIRQLAGAADNPHHDDAVASAHAALASISSIGEDAVGALFASAPGLLHAGIELEFELGGEHPHVTVRQTTSAEADVGGAEMEVESARTVTEIPLTRERHAAPSSSSSPSPDSLVCE